jgi:hypothetical protein
VVLMVASRALVFRNAPPSAYRLRVRALDRL